MQFADIADSQNAIKNVLSKELRKAAELEVKKMLTKLEGGAKIYEVNPQWGNKVSDILKKYYKKIYDTANTDVKKELKSQGAKLSELKFADMTSEFEKWAAEQASIGSELLSADIKKSFVEYYAQAINKGLTADAINEFIFDQYAIEVGQRYNSAADRAVNAYGNAREVSAQEVAENGIIKIRTEIFDNNICQQCAEEDGKEYAMDDDSISPPFDDCQGGDKCRGMWLYQMP